MPIRVSQTQGWLSNLILLEENIPWWSTVTKDLKNTRRGVTFSLVAQVVAAALAWVFTLIISFVGDLGSSTGLQIATGSVWLWMIPVIWGWIVVGTQEGPDSIEKALNDGNRQTFRINGQDLIEERQQGILAQSGTYTTSPMSYPKDARSKQTGRLLQISYLQISPSSFG